MTSQLDTVEAHIEFEHGCIARMKASRVAEEKIRQTRIHQADGVITIDYLSQKASFARTGPPSGGSASDVISRDIFVRKVDLLETEIRSFLQSVRDRQPPRVSGHDGKRALEVALRIVRSAAEETRQVRK